MALTCSSVPPPGTCEKMRKQLVTRRLAAVKVRAGKIALPCGSRQAQKDPVMNCHVFLAPSGPSPRRWHSGSSRRWLRQVHEREIRFDETWMKYCLVWHIPGHPVRCSCWAMSWHSHCVHQHIAEEWWGLETWTEGLVPRNPRRGAATRSPSEEATNPRARKKAAR